MDPSHSLIRALPIFASIALTPLAMRLLSRLFPPGDLPGIENFNYRRARNGWINAIACLLGLGSFVLPFLLFGRNLNKIGWPALGVAFGSAVILPCLWICLATIPFGLSRYQEFWRYYEQRYRLSATGVMVIYVPLAALGVLSALELIRRGLW